MERQNEYVLRTVEERGVRFVRLWFTDVLGFLKSVEITPAELQVALEEGITFDGSTIEGYSRIQESDMLARPDANTFELLPSEAGDTVMARMFCDISTYSSTPFEGDPRRVLKRNLEKAREKGHSLEGASLASDAFFPFSDGPQLAVDAGVTAIIQPGGSVRDHEVVEAADAAGISMVFTHRRHFRH